MLDLTQYYHIIGKLGEDSIQNYILNLGYFYNKENNLSMINMPLVIDNGSMVLTQLLRNKKVSKNTIDKKSYIKPNIQLDEYLKDCRRIYHVRTNKDYDLNPYKFELGEDSFNTIIHNHGFQKIGYKNKEVLKYLNNVELEVNSEYSKYPRLPKNIESKDFEQYKRETELFKDYIQEYNNQSIYFYHQFDNRGRIYPKAYPLNYQGDKFSKSVLDFKNKKQINKLGLIWLGRDICNQYGLDKLSFSDKDEWISKNQDLIYTISKGEYLEQAEDPIRLIKACKAYIDALDGKEIGYMCGIDASASGISIMSLLTKDELGCKYTNLIDSKNRYDLYTELTKKFVKEVKGEITPELLKRARPLVKKASMTYFYNSVKTLRKTFKNNEYYIDVFMNILKNTCKGAYDLMNRINELYYRSCTKLRYISYIMPDGFQVALPQYVHQYYNVETPLYKALFRYNEVKESNMNMRALCPNILHSKSLAVYKSG